MTSKIKKLDKNVRQMPDRKYTSKCDHYRDQIGRLHTKNCSAREISRILKKHGIYIFRSTLSRYLLKKPYSDYEKQIYKEKFGEAIKNDITSMDKNKTRPVKAKKNIDIENNKQRALTPEEFYQKYDARHKESDIEKEINQKLKQMGRKSLFGDY